MDINTIDVSLCMEIPSLRIQPVPRYGENVLEALQNPDWVCPVCRGICNCSLCRNAKGWAPTGIMYKKVVHAHNLCALIVLL